MVFRTLFALFRATICLGAGETLQCRQLSLETRKETVVKMARWTGQMDLSLQDERQSGRLER